MTHTPTPCKTPITINCPLTRIQVQILHSTITVTRIRVKGTKGMNALVDIHTANLKKYLRQDCKYGMPVFPETKGSNDILWDAYDSSLVCVLVAHGYIKAGISEDCTPKWVNMIGNIHDIQEVNGYEI